MWGQSRHRRVRCIVRPIDLTVKCTSQLHCWYASHVACISDRAGPTQHAVPVGSDCRARCHPRKLMPAILPPREDVCERFRPRRTIFSRPHGCRRRNDQMTFSQWYRRTRGMARVQVGDVIKDQQIDDRAPWRNEVGTLVAPPNEGHALLRAPTTDRGESRRVGADPKVTGLFELIKTELKLRGTQGHRTNSLEVLALVRMQLSHRLCRLVSKVP